MAHKEAINYAIIKMNESINRTKQNQQKQIQNNPHIANKYKQYDILNW